MSPATLHDVGNISTNPSTVLSRSILMGEEGGVGGGRGQKFLSRKLTKYKKNHLAKFLHAFYETREEDCCHS